MKRNRRLQWLLLNEGDIFSRYFFKSSPSAFRQQLLNKYRNLFQNRPRFVNSERMGSKERAPLWKARDHVSSASQQLGTLLSNSNLLALRRFRLYLTYKTYWRLNFILVRLYKVFLANSTKNLMAATTRALTFITTMPGPTFVRRRGKQRWPLRLYWALHRTNFARYRYRWPADTYSSAKRVINSRPRLYPRSYSPKHGFKQRNYRAPYKSKYLGQLRLRRSQRYNLLKYTVKKFCITRFSVIRPPLVVTTFTYNIISNYAFKSVFIKGQLNIFGQTMLNFTKAQIYNRRLHGQRTFHRYNTLQKAEYQELLKNMKAPLQRRHVKVRYSEVLQLLLAQRLMHFEEYNKRWFIHRKDILTYFFWNRLNFILLRSNLIPSLYFSQILVQKGVFVDGHEVYKNDYHCSVGSILTFSFQVKRFLLFILLARLQFSRRGTRMRVRRLKYRRHWKHRMTKYQAKRHGRFHFKPRKFYSQFVKRGRFNYRLKDKFYRHRILLRRNQQLLQSRWEYRLFFGEFLDQSRAWLLAPFMHYKRHLRSRARVKYRKWFYTQALFYNVPASIEINYRVLAIIIIDLMVAPISSELRRLNAMRLTQSY